MSTKKPFFDRDTEVLLLDLLHGSKEHWKQQFTKAIQHLKNEKTWIKGVFGNIGKGPWYNAYGAYKDFYYYHLADYPRKMTISDSRFADPLRRGQRIRFALSHGHHQ